jgi:hypothetical protein
MRTEWAGWRLHGPGLRLASRPPPFSLAEAAGAASIPAMPDGRQPASIPPSALGNEAIRSLGGFGGGAATAGLWVGMDKGVGDLGGERGGGRKEEGFPSCPGSSVHRATVTLLRVRVTQVRHNMVGGVGSKPAASQQ